MWKLALSQGIIHKTHIMKFFGKMLAVTDGAGNVLETYTHGADLSGQDGRIGYASFFAAGSLCAITSAITCLTRKIG